MTQLRNPEIEVFQFRARVLVAGVLVLVCLGLLVARFVWLQVVRHQDYLAQAESNRVAVLPIVPNRGLIKDRNGVVIAKNYSAYTLEITPSKVEDLDATIEELGKLVDIQPRDKRRFKKLREETRRFDSIPIRTRLSDDEVARFSAQRWRFPGVELRARLFRHYPLGETGAHMIGYIGRISQRDQERIDKLPDASDYNGTQYIGKVGVEQSYEGELHGTTGYEEVETTAGGRAVRRLSNSPATPGNNLVLSIDIKLQEIVERAFGDRRGALIAIEPRTGDVLAFVSKPGFDPNLFVEGIDPKNWDELNHDPDKPLLNRALRGTYPIGSTYKPFLALGALASGKRGADTVIQDNGVFVFGNHRFRDSAKVPNGPVNMHRSIVVSSDVYYYSLANEMGVNLIHDTMKPWGFGQITGIDVEGEQRGILPSTEWKEKRFKQKWFPGETISIGIGQGYNAFTLLQLAHATANLANGGVVMKPHLVKSIEDPSTGERRLTVPAESYRIPVKPEHLALVTEAMVGVNVSGTGRVVFAGAPYRVAGKTGTAQVVGIKQNEKYVESRMKERHRDHSLYIAFAPAEDPKIALAVIVENGGFGARAAAPIARQAIDYWLLGIVPDKPALPPRGSDRDDDESDENVLAMTSGRATPQVTDAAAPKAAP
ncbi:MAG TPA: penicillin-binding protein 2 [Burkholderiaceae bacterium]|jgi:penicillin-binding protein 2|nr:penicillin-binding protein 2 [Burkholderiaceae bacterium]HPE02802.1 penicillin-binding protein 2 [Burkholderiaceae bacterium]HRZ02256.1 penicillin-binding protein 2 [Burkholderiaceae bacterium]